MKMMGWMIHLNLLNQLQKRSMGAAMRSLLGIDPNQRMHGIHGSIIQGNVMNIEKRGNYEKLVCDLYQSGFLVSI